MSKFRKKYNNYKNYKLQQNLCGVPAEILPLLLLITLFAISSPENGTKTTQEMVSMFAFPPNKSSVTNRLLNSVCSMS